MKKCFNIIGLLIVVFLMESCSIFGIHYYLHNPEHAGKLPRFSEEHFLLAGLTKYKSCYDVTYYDLSVEIIPTDRKLDGSVVMFAKAVEDFDTLQIDLHQNFEITRLLDGQTNQPLSYTRNKRAVFIEFPGKKDESFVLKISYVGTPKIA